MAPKVARIAPKGIGKEQLVEYLPVYFPIGDDNVNHATPDAVRDAVALQWGDNINESGEINCHFLAKQLPRNSARMRAPTSCM